MKIQNVLLKGSGAHVLPINTVVEARLTNTSASAQLYKIELKEVDSDNVIVLAQGELEAKASTVIKCFAEAQQTLRIEADESVHTLLSKLQETTAGSGGYSLSRTYYVGDGTRRTFALGNNKPANNSLEVSVVIDSFYRARFGRDWSFSDDKSEIVMLKTPYAGADIEITLQKQE